jgi:hypothetical protein
VRGIQRLDGHDLRPVRDDDGSVSYDAGEVDAYVRASHPESTPDVVPPSGEGALASRIFAAFKSGKSQRDVVIELGVEPDVVRAHYAQWLALDDCVVAIKGPQWATMRSILGPINSVDELLPVLGRVATAAHERSKFWYPCAYCGVPILASADREWKQAIETKRFLDWSHPECLERARNDRRIRHTTS